MKSLKPLKFCTREEQILRSLIIIESISLVYDGIKLDNNDDVLGNIYAICHGVLGHCHPCKRNTHWMKIVEKYEKQFKEDNVVNSERVIKKCEKVCPKNLIPLYLRG